MPPPELQITVNGTAQRVAAGTTLRALIREAGLEGHPVAAEVNREVIPFRKHADRILVEGDRIELVTLVGGG